MVKLLQYDAGGIATGLRQLAALPPRHAMAPPPHPGAAAGVEATGGGDHGTAGGDVETYDMPRDLPGEAWYRMLVTPWGCGQGHGGRWDEGRDGVEGGECPTPAEYFQRSSWGMPGLFSGELRPVGQAQVWRLYDEVRQMALECMEMMEDIGVEDFEEEEFEEGREYEEGETEEEEEEQEEHQEEGEEEVPGKVEAQEAWGEGEGMGHGGFREERQSQEEGQLDEAGGAVDGGDGERHNGRVGATSAARKKGAWKEESVKGSLEEVE